MPLIKSNFKPSKIFRYSFFSTVYSGLIRSFNLIQKRERIPLYDGDFLDLDWSYAVKPTKRLGIVLHGMEGNGQRPYVSGVAACLNSQNFDAICVNFRGCSGETNNKFFSFHSGQTEDLEAVIEHIISNYNYDSIYLKGVSLGGNIVLKYLGENSEIPKQIKAAMALSVPVDLDGSVKALHKLKNIFYHIYFMMGLKFKLMKKQRQFPQLMSRIALWKIWTLHKLDEVYTSRANGFENANDYYKKSSSLQFLSKIQTPVLILNALNDSFLPNSCYPISVAENNPSIYLEIPRHGGHVGFVLPGKFYYNEIRALEFFSKF